MAEKHALAMVLTRTFLILSLMNCWFLNAQTHTEPLAKVYAGADGLAHIVSASGEDRAIGREPEQVAVESLQLSSDRRAVGWLVEVKNCCTSYPIPTRLVIYDETGRKHIMTDGLMIYDWKFAQNGHAAAVSSGTVHGMTYRNLTLYSVSSGKALQHWEGNQDAVPPPWAQSLEQ